MPHFPNTPITIGSTSAWRMVAQQEGMAGLDTLLSQVGGGAGAGFTMANKGDIWDLYSASGDSLDLAHRLFGGTLYIIPTVTTLPVLGSILFPTDEEEGTPEEPPQDPPPRIPTPEVSDVPDIGSGSLGATGPGVAGSILGGIGSRTAIAAGAVLADAVTNYLRNWGLGGVSGGSGSQGLSGASLLKGEENMTAKSLGFRYRR